jgi:hypothetical protein
MTVTAATPAEDDLLRELVPGKIKTLDIHEEYQTWILIGTTFVMFGILCCPCYFPQKCCTPVLRFIRRRTCTWVFLALAFDWVLLNYVCSMLPNWTVNGYLNVIGSKVGWFLANLEDLLLSVLVILVATFVWVLRIQILKMLGIDHMTFVRCQASDFCWCFFSTRQLQAIEVAILKVEGMRSAVMLRPNDIFVELHLGFNEIMCTRVMYGAGEQAKVKQALQLNFDEFDSGYELYIIAKHQDVFSSEEVGRAVMNTDEIAQRMNKTDLGGAWDEEREFFPVQMEPQGTVWLRIGQVSDNDHQGQTVMSRLITGVRE